MKTDGAVGVDGAAQEKLEHRRPSRRDNVLWVCRVTSMPMDHDEGNHEEADLVNSWTKINGRLLNDTVDDLRMVSISYFWRNGPLDSKKRIAMFC